MFMVAQLAPSADKKVVRGNPPGNARGIVFCLGIQRIPSLGIYAWEGEEGQF